tara:strand:+ start:74 stop:250 length:177 start_codon:yes stop_codon:yes gene_type:complete
MADDKDKRVVDLNDINFRNKDVMRWIDQPTYTPVKYAKSTFGLKGTGTTTAVPRIKRK